MKLGDENQKSADVISRAGKATEKHKSWFNDYSDNENIPISANADLVEPWEKGQKQTLFQYLPVSIPKNLEPKIWSYFRVYDVVPYEESRELLKHS